MRTRPPAALALTPQPPALAPLSTPPSSVAWSGPSRPFAQFPGLAPIVGCCPPARLRAGPTGGVRAAGGWHAAPGEPLSAGARVPRGENKGAHSPRAQPVASPGRWRSPRGPGGARPRLRAAESDSLFPAGCWRKPAEQLPHSQLRVWRWRSEVLLPSPLGSPSISRAAPRCALPLVPLSRVAGSAPFQARPPPPGPPASPQLPPSPTRGARSPRPGSLSLRGHPLPSPGPALPRRSTRVSASHGATRPRPRSWCGRFAVCRILQIPEPGPSAAALERPAARKRARAR